MRHLRTPGLLHMPHTENRRILTELENFHQQQPKQKLSDTVYPQEHMHGVAGSSCQHSHGLERR
jgi:hypothetical protein